MKLSLNNKPATAHSDDYVPSHEEIAEAIEQAEEMNRNMQLYGTIDKPKSVQAEDQSHST